MVLAAARFEKTEYTPVAGAITDFYMSTITPGLDALTEPERQVAMLVHAAELFPDTPVIFMLNPTPGLYPELIRNLKAEAGDSPITTEHLGAACIPDPALCPEHAERVREFFFAKEKIPADVRHRFGYCDGILRFENPFDTMVELVGSSEWFLKIASDPEFVNTAMELFTEASIAGAEALAEQIGPPRFVILAEDFPGYIRKKDFDRFVLPWHRMIFETFPDAVKLLHNDSNTTHILDSIAGCGMDVFHFGYETDVRAARVAMKGRAALMGNLSPMKVLAHAPLETVVSECNRILSEGAGPGFIFATGGEVNPGTDPERVNLMVECAKRHGAPRGNF